MNYERGYTCETDHQNNVFLVGITNSPSLGLGGFQNTLMGSFDAFLAKFSSSGQLRWSTYLDVTGHAIAVDSAGCIYFAGEALSSTNIVFNGHQNIYGGGLRDAFLAKIFDDCDPALSIDTHIACDSFVWMDGNTYYTDNNYATYTISNGAASGCDSIIILDLMVNYPTLGVDTQIVCGPLTWIDGNTYTVSNDSATYILVGGAANGCDSIVTLFYETDKEVTDVHTACDSFVWIDGNTYTTSNNTATHTLPTVFGCDSIITLDLTLNNSTSATDVIAACDEYTWIDGNTYTASDSTATYTITNSVGCDSVITLDLSIKYSEYRNDTVSACSSYTWINGTTYSTTTIDSFIIPGGASNGCDRIFRLYYTYGNLPIGLDSIDTCGHITWIDGNTYTSSNNTATHNLIGAAANGCDSLVTLDLTITPQPLIVVNEEDELTINGNTAGANFQWYRCDGAQRIPIQWAIGSTFLPPASGSYSVEVTGNWCAGTSPCFPYNIITGINTNQQSQVNVYPNPNTGQINIDLGNAMTADFYIYSVDGKLLQQQLNNAPKTIHQLEMEVPSGMYLLEIRTDQQISHHKIIQQ